MNDHINIQNTNTQEINKTEEEDTLYNVWLFADSSVGIFPTDYKEIPNDAARWGYKMNYNDAVNLREKLLCTISKRRMDKGVVNQHLSATEESEDILHEAFRITGGDRNDDYGDPATEFEKVAKMWSVIIGAPVEMRHVPMCMIALKLVREGNRPKRDNAVDISGYARVMHLANTNQKVK